MKILLIGSGAREHALAQSLAADPVTTELHASPGNPGIAKIATCHPLDINNPLSVATLARTLEVDLVVIGPEGPLVTGAADAVAKAGGKVTYTYTVGQTAGKYAAVVDFTGATTTFAQYATVQNPSYEISTGGDTTSNADVLKSIVALIASINKQIQALQKLILKR